MSRPPRSVVVVGGGLGGVSTVVELRRGGFEGAVTLLEAGDLLHDRPPLSKQFLAGTSTEADIGLLAPGWADSHDVTVRTGAPVARLAATAGAVLLGDGSEVRADAVVLAVGGRARRLPVPGGDLPVLHTLRDVTDARALRSRLQPGCHLVVVGAGLVGAEVAATAVGLGCRVTLVDPDPLPLAKAFGAEVAQVLHAAHAAHGVQVREAGVDRFDEVPEGVRVQLADGSHLRADVVLVSVGIDPDCRLASTAGLAVSAGVLVGADLRSSVPAVLVVGDAARGVGQDGVPLPRVEHWEAAQRDGVTAAATLLGAPPPAHGAPWFWSDRYGRHAEVVGAPGSASTTVLRGDVGTGPGAVFGLRDGRLVSVAAVDEPRVVRAARRLVDGAVRVDAEALADPATDVRSLGRQ